MDTRLRDIPILFLTGLVRPAEAGATPMESGGRQFLAKPVEPGLLLSTVDRLTAAVLA